MPQISVVMSVYNTEKYLAQAIKSILNQTYSDFEFIIIDDGSTDNTLQIIRSFFDHRIKVISRENKGLAYSLNEGIKLSRCNLIARMDPDDISFPSRLEKQIKFLKANIDIGIVGTSAILIDENGNDIGSLNLPKDHLDLINLIPPRKFSSSPFVHGSVLFRKEFVIKAGGYAEGCHFEDIILWKKLSEMTYLANLDEVLFKFRVSPFARTNLSPLQIRKREYLINKFIENREFSKKDIVFMKKLENVSVQTRKYYYHIKIGNLYLKNGRIWNGFLEGLASWILNPFLFSSYKIIVKSILKFFKI